MKHGWLEYSKIIIKVSVTDGWNLMTLDDVGVLFNIIIIILTDKILFWCWTDCLFSNNCLRGLVVSMLDCNHEGRVNIVLIFSTGNSQSGSLEISSAICYFSCICCLKNIISFLFKSHILELFQFFNVMFTLIDFTTHWVSSDNLL